MPNYFYENLYFDFALYIYLLEAYLHAGSNVRVCVIV